MKIIEEKNNQDPQGKFVEYEPRPRNKANAITTIRQLRKQAKQDKSIIQNMVYRLRTINSYPHN